MPQILQRLVSLLFVTVCIFQYQSFAGGNPLQSTVNAQTSADNQEQETYESWMQPFRNGALHGPLNEAHTIELAITIFRNDEVDPEAKGRSPLTPPRLKRGIVTSFYVSTEGTVSMQRTTSMAVQGGGPGKLPEEDFKKLVPLITELPDDHSRLPPLSRRLVVQVANPKGIEARVYDKANAPESILEMLRLIGADIWPIYDFPRFQPDQRWEKEDVSNAGIDLNAVGLDYSHDTILAISPDRNLIAAESSSFLEPTVHTEWLQKAVERQVRPGVGSVLRIRNASGATVHEFPEPLCGRYPIYIYAARFTPDGRFLLVMSSIPDIRIYDTSSWKSVDRIPGLPKGVVAYHPSSDWKRGVAVFPSGVIELLDIEAGRTLAVIDPGDDLQYVTFSPDGSRVATVTRTKHLLPYEAHLRIWATSTGDMAHELMPLEATPRDGFGKPVWSQNGEYLFAPTREGHFGGGFSVGIWNAKTGRYRGTLAGCAFPQQEDSPILLVGEDVYRACGYDGLLRWDAGKALMNIRDFEKSLLD